MISSASLEVGGAVRRLHRRDDVEGAEARDVDRQHVLGVLDAQQGVETVGPHRLERAEHEPVRLVADGVRDDVETVAGGQQGALEEHVVGHRGDAAALVADERLGHVGRVRAERAVAEELDGADAEDVVALAGTAALLDRQARGRGRACTS